MERVFRAGEAGTRLFGADGRSFLPSLIELELELELEGRTSSSSSSSSILTAPAKDL
jgi:hypothetical protein